MTDDDVAKIARVCHEVNRAICIAFDDYSQFAWEDAPEWQKKSVIAGVQFKIANPDATPEDQHKSWLEQKVTDGWVYGPTKDPVKKTHPCMVQYGDLPPEQRVKDYAFVAIVGAMS